MELKKIGWEIITVYSSSLPAGLIIKPAADDRLPCCFFFCISSVHGGGGQGSAGWQGRVSRETILVHGILSVHGQGLVWKGGASMLSICRAELSALLRLCLAVRLPVSLGGLAKCLKLHLNALCSVLIRTRADSHSPLSCFWPHGIPYHV